MYELFHQRLSESTFIEVQNAEGKAFFPEPSLLESDGTYFSHFLALPPSCPLSPAMLQELQGSGDQGRGLATNFSLARPL